MQFSIQEVINELPFPVDMKDNIFVQDIFKMLGIRISDLVQCSLLERILTVIEIIESLQLYKVIIFINLKNYFTDKELNELYKQAIHCKIKIMILEYGETNKVFPYEKIWVIDEDYEEFKH